MTSEQLLSDDQIFNQIKTVEDYEKLSKLEKELLEVMVEVFASQYTIANNIKY